LGIATRFREVQLISGIVEGRSELRNAGRVNCKTHWPFSGCGTPYLLNIMDAGSV
jgi:hypothetical protein